MHWLTIDIQNREKKFILYFGCCKQLHNKCVHKCCLKLIIGNNYLCILWRKKNKIVKMIQILKLNYDKDENRYKRYNFIMLVFFTFINYVYLLYVYTYNFDVRW